MADKTRGTWTRVRNNIRKGLVSGSLLLVPFGVTLLIMRWLFNWMAGFLEPTVKRVLAGLLQYPVIKAVPETYVSLCVSLLSILILLALLYVVGAVGRRIAGKRLIAAGEKLVLKIPLVGMIYSATKQVMEAISLPDRTAFRSVVLVEFPRPGFRSLGFLTGYIEDSTGRMFSKVFIPTTPNPTTGFLEIVPREEVVETNMRIEEAFKMIISGGIIAPSTLSLAEGPPGVPAPASGPGPAAPGAGPQETRPLLP